MIRPVVQGRPISVRGELDDCTQRGKLVFKSVEAGAATGVWAATSPTLEGKGGLYLEDCQIAVEVEPPEESHGYFAYALDPDLPERLWAKTEELIGERFDV